MCMRRWWVETEGGEETREKRPGNFPLLFSSVLASDKVEGKSKQVGGDAGEELRTFSGVRLSDAAGTTRISPTCPKVRRHHWCRRDPHQSCPMVVSHYRLCSRVPISLM